MKNLIKNVIKENIDLISIAVFLFIVIVIMKIIWWGFG